MAAQPLKLNGVYVCLDCKAPVLRQRADGSLHRPPARCSGCSREHFAVLAVVYNRAHGTVASAIRRGLLRRPSEFPCVDCGGGATQYDHRDYDEPLKVEPVCRSCNKKRGSAVFTEVAYAQREVDTLYRPCARPDGPGNFREGKG